jgi:predicted RecA/RadA family phage recombinase
MKNFIKPGNMTTLVAASAVSSGQGMLVGALFGVAATNAAQGAEVEACRKGEFELAAVTADTATQGAKAYWDDTAKKITTTATNNTLVGAFTVAKANGDTVARVLLDGVVR